MSEATTQGAETMTAGQVAFERYYEKSGAEWDGISDLGQAQWERAAAAALSAACRPWEHYTGEPPDDESPLSGVFVAGMAYTERLLAKLLDVTHYEGGDGSEDFDSDATQTLRNILTGAGLWDADENCPVTATPSPRTDGGMTAGEVDPTKVVAGLTFYANRYAERRNLAETLLAAVHTINRLTIPAQAGAVPDGLRALSEALAFATAERKRTGDLYNAAARRAERTFEDLTEVYEAFEDAISKLRDAKDALADHCLSLLASHPAGQSAGSGAETVEWGSANTVGELMAQLRTLPADAKIFGTFKGPDDKGDDYRTGVRGVLLSRERVRGRWIRTQDKEAPYEHVIWTVPEPAPDSTRTGQGEADCKPDELTETEIRSRAAALISAKGWKPGETLHFKAVLDLMTEHGMAVASNPPQDRCAHPACGCDADSVCGSGLAARPAAPEAQGAWQDIGTVPVGVEVIVRGGKTVFGDGPRGSSITVVDDREDLYRPDGSLRPSSPTMWHPAPAPPASSGQGGVKP